MTGVKWAPSAGRSGFVWLTRVFVLSALLLSCLIACSSEDAPDDPGENVATTAEALTLAEIWGMENATGWTIVTGTATKQASTIRNQGNFSLQLTAPAFVAVRGDAVAKPASISSLLAVDVMVPNQSGPYLGAVQMVLNVPSLNINSAFIGQRDLSAPTGVWQTLHFQIPSNIYAQLLASPFNDLSVVIGVNPPAGLNQPYRLDNLRFVPVPSCVGVPNGTACDDSVTCTTGTTCSGGICGSVTPPGALCDPGDDVLGFENFPAWQVTTGAASLAPSTTRVQGARSLSVTTLGFTTVTSVNLATLHKVSQTLSLRVRKPTNQPNPSWHGDLTLNLTVPSLGINFSATRPLTGQPNGSFFELLFQLPTSVYQSLAAQNYSDLRFAITINPPTGQTGFYLLDDLHFVPVTSCNGVINRTACEDSSLCTTGDACNNGICGTVVTCVDGNVCTDDSCNPATGCVFTNNTAPCTDSNACTTADRCQSGACIPGPPLTCNDANVCTTDSCFPPLGCVFAPNTLPCDDGNICTTNDQCGAGACVPGAPRVCDDGNVCTSEACAQGIGCLFVPNTAPCSDGNACTVGDQCSNRVCQPGVPAPCNDGNVCTDDVCVAPTGCVHINNTATCTDHNACTGVNATGADVCSGGICASGPPVNCDDGSACTQDICDGGSGCIHNFICGSNVCFNNACCAPNSCVGLHAECGNRSDGCGSTLACGACPTGGTCNPAGRCLRPNNFREPQGINVCEILLEKLIIPPTFEDVLTCKHFDLSDCLNPFSGVPPDCCVPGLCMLDPFCTFFNPVQITAEIIFNPGDVYCSITLTPEQYFDRLVQGRLADLATLSAFLSTGGLAGLFDFDIQVMVGVGRQAPDHVRSLIRTLIQPVYDGGVTGFSHADMDNVVIVSSDFPTAGLYLPGARLAITLGPVIILKASLYSEIFASSNSGVSYAEFLTDPAVDKNYIEAVDVLIHEFVHVKQYRELGRFNFYHQYLGEALSKGYGQISFEQEAFTFEIGIAQSQGGRLCSVMADAHNAAIDDFGLPIPLSTCPPEP